MTDRRTDGHNYDNNNVRLKTGAKITNPWPILLIKNLACKFDNLPNCHNVPTPEEMYVAAKPIGQWLSSGQKRINITAEL